MSTGDFDKWLKFFGSVTFWRINEKMAVSKLFCWNLSLGKQIFLVKAWDLADFLDLYKALFDVGVLTVSKLFCWNLSLGKIDLSCRSLGLSRFLGSPQSSLRRRHFDRVEASSEKI